MASGRIESSGTRLAMRKNSLPGGIARGLTRNRTEIYALDESPLVGRRPLCAAQDDNATKMQPAAVANANLLADTSRSPMNLKHTLTGNIQQYPAFESRILRHKRELLGYFPRGYPRGAGAGGTAGLVF